jgi:hypothetical protein
MSSRKVYLGPVGTLYEARDADMLVAVHCLCCPRESRMHPMRIIQKQKRLRDIPFYQPTTIFLCRCGKKYADIRPVTIAEGL